jgi:hypothetical protein
MSNQITETELDSLLEADEMQIGQTYRLMKSGVTSLKELVERNVAGNSGVASNNKAMIASILTGEVPKSASLATKTARVIRRLISNGVPVSVETTAYLNDLLAQLANRASAVDALEHDQISLLKQSDLLSEQARHLANAIYVYSFPTYMHYGTIEDPELKWLKLGSTKNSVWQRILDQSRQTSMPEDPVLVRIYHLEGMDLAEVEKKFHRTLERVGHERSSATRTRAGKEWFATTEDALDALAELMGLQIESDITF